MLSERDDFLRRKKLQEVLILVLMEYALWGRDVMEYWYDSKTS